MKIGMCRAFYCLLYSSLLFFFFVRNQFARFLYNLLPASFGVYHSFKHNEILLLIRSLQELLYCESIYTSEVS